MPVEMPEQTMTMDGISPGLFLIAAVLLAAVTLLIPWRLEARRTGPGNPASSSAGWRLDLLQSSVVTAMVRARTFQFFLRLPFVFLFLFIIFAGLFGAQSSDRNIASLLTWTVWWASLVIFILFLGKIWCLVCPWNAIAEWIQRLTFWKKKETTISLNLPWPRRLRNIYLATGLFVGLTWLELGFGVTTSPVATAGLGLLILAMAVIPALYHDRKPFCRYGCLVGRVSGLYALFSPVELRARDTDVCRDVCHTRDCVQGNERGYGCPTNEYLGTMDLNTYCILCTECIKTCPHDNVAFNLRPFAADLTKSARLRADEAYLCLAMLSLTIFHGFTMTPVWADSVLNVRDAFGIGDFGQTVAFTLGMTLVLGLPIAAFLGIAWASRWLAGRGKSLGEVFVAYAYMFLPVALLYHLAHNVQHLLREGQKIVPLLSDPLGWGWNLFGTAAWSPGPLASLASIQYAQVIFVLLGHAVGIYVAFYVSRRMTTARSAARLSLAPVLLLALGFSLVNLWLLAQPMQMRSAM